MYVDVVLLGYDDAWCTGSHQLAVVDVDVDVAKCVSSRLFGCPWLPRPRVDIPSLPLSLSLPGPSGDLLSVRPPPSNNKLQLSPIRASKREDPFWQTDRQAAWQGRAGQRKAVKVPRSHPGAAGFLFFLVSPSDLTVSVEQAGSDVHRIHPCSPPSGHSSLPTNAHGWNPRSCMAHTHTHTPRHPLPFLPNARDQGSASPLSVSCPLFRRGPGDLCGCRSPGGKGRKVDSFFYLLPSLSHSFFLSCTGHQRPVRRPFRH